MKKSELLELLQELAMEDLEDGADIADHPCTLAAECIKSLDSEANKWAVAYRQSKEEAQRLQAELAELREAKDKMYSAMVQHYRELEQRIQGCARWKTFPRNL